MEDYPNFGVGVSGYSPDRSNGSQVIRGENGQPFLFILWDRTRSTFTITHPALTIEQEEVITNFYEANKSDPVRFYDPRTRKHYNVLMQGPPRISGMRSGFHADIEMTLLEI